MTHSVGMRKVIYILHHHEIKSEHVMSASHCSSYHCIIIQYLTVPHQPKAIFYHHSIWKSNTFASDCTSAVVNSIKSLSYTHAKWKRMRHKRPRKHVHHEGNAETVFIRRKSRLKGVFYHTDMQFRIYQPFSEPSVYIIILGSTSD